MADHLIEGTPSADACSLLIKQLLLTSLVHAPEQEIVYRGPHRYSYRRLAERIDRLANMGVCAATEKGLLLAKAK